MNVDEFEQGVYRTAAEWSFIRSVETIDRTDYAIKLRLHVDTECFIQVYANVAKEILSYTVVLNRLRVYGRDNDGGEWHRHPHGSPESHDRSPEGQREVALSAFLAEAQQILTAVGLL